MRPKLVVNFRKVGNDKELKQWKKSLNSDNNIEVVMENSVNELILFFDNNIGFYF